MEGHNRNIFIPSQGWKTGCHFATSGKFIFNRIESAGSLDYGHLSAIKRVVGFSQAACFNRNRLGEIESAQPLLRAPFRPLLTRSLSLLSFDDAERTPSCNRLVRLGWNVA